MMTEPENTFDPTLHYEGQTVLPSFVGPNFDLSRVIDVMQSHACQMLPPGTRYKIVRRPGFVHAQETCTWYSDPARFSEEAEWENPPDPLWDGGNREWVLRRLSVPEPQKAPHIPLEIMEQLCKQISGTLTEELSGRFGFILLMSDLRDQGYVTYRSNMTERNAVVLLSELVQKIMGGAARV